MVDFPCAGTEVYLYGVSGFGQDSVRDEAICTALRHRFKSGFNHPTSPSEITTFRTEQG